MDNVTKQGCDLEHVWERSVIYLTHPVRGSKRIRVGLTVADGFGGLYAYLGNDRRLHIHKERIVMVEEMRGRNRQNAWARIGPGLGERLKIAAAAVCGVGLLWLGIAALISKAWGQ